MSTKTNVSIPSISSFSISRNKLDSVQIDDTWIFKEAVKKTHHLKYGSLGDVSAYDEKGNPITGILDLGVQYDHRVSWLHFDLEKLDWWASDIDDDPYSKLNKFNYYTFKLALTRLNNYGQAQETTVWEFDGVDFEIPRGITKEAGIYEMVLIIEEYQGEEDGNVEGNVPDEGGHIERFVAKPIQGQVFPTFFDPKETLTVLELQTQQKAALAKGAILATLTDDGTFVLDDRELGQQFDSFTRYIKFYPERISKHLDMFTICAVFKQNDAIACSLFETTQENELDDWDAEQPLIAWIPTEVYQSPGSWNIIIFAFFGNENDMNNINDPEADLNGDYYFFVSKETSGSVIKNNLTLSDVTSEPILSVTSNILTNAGEIIITADGDIYVAANKGDGND